MTTRGNRLRSFLFLLAGGLGLAFGQGHWPNGLALILGVACMVRFFRLAHPGVALPCFIIVHFAALEWAYAGMVPMPTPARLAMWFGISLVLGLLLLVDRWVSRRRSSFATTLLLPCGWVAFELASARLSPGGTWGSLAYSFADVVVIAQIASLVGWTGLTFVAVWTASVVNWWWIRRVDEPVRGRRGLVLAAECIAALVVFGVVRVATAPDPGDATPVRVACVIAPNTYEDETLDDVWAYTRGVDRPAESVERARARIAESMDEHFAMVEGAISAGAQLVSWPEVNAVMTAAESDAWIDRAKGLAAAHSVSIGMGMAIFRPETQEPSLNTYMLVDPTGHVAIDFLKATRVPGRHHATGDGVLPVVDTDLGRLSAAICFDLDFPHVIRQPGTSRVDALLAPSNDWREAQATHARMARLRAIEQGFALVRPTKDGTTLITDATGRCCGHLTLDDNQTGSIIVDVPFAHRRTLYVTIGDAFAWICVAGLVALCALTAIQRRSVAAPMPDPNSR